MHRTILTACITMVLAVPAAPSTAAPIDDQAMARTIGSQLKQSGQLRDYRIAVKYQDGVAWLNGTVVDERQMSAAVRLARQTRGVSHVVNNLTINGPSSGNRPSGNGHLDVGQGLKQANFTSRQTRAKQQTRPRRQAATRLPNQRNNRPRAMGVRQASAESYGARQAGYGRSQMPAGHMAGGMGQAVNYDSPQMPGYAMPSYASQSNYAAISYPKQYSPSAWPYIGPFYPYPQVPLGWRKVSLEWDDGWWFLDFSDNGSNH